MSYFWYSTFNFTRIEYCTYTLTQTCKYIYLCFLKTKQKLYTKYNYYGMFMLQTLLYIQKRKKK